VRLLVLPIVAAGLVLYVCMSLYLSELLQFLGAPNPRVASFALGILAAGIFLSLFCYAIAVVSITNLALGKAGRRAWFHVRAERQTWRVYAAYMRFLLLLCLVFIRSIFFRLTSRPCSLSRRIHALGAHDFKRAGHLYPYRSGRILDRSCRSGGRGTVLRKAWQLSARDSWRNCVLIALLIVPGLLVQVAGEYVLQFGALGSPRGRQSVVRRLHEGDGRDAGKFLVVVSLSSFVTIVLLTVGAVAVYQHGRCAGCPRRWPLGPSLDRSVPAEGPQE